ncbi:MAG: NHL repeat-containing protein [bacterium]
MPIRQWGGKGTLEGSLSRPSDVASDPQGRLYVVERRGCRVSVFYPSGDLFNAWGRFGKGLGAMDMPVAVGVNATGEVYVLEHYRSRVKVYDRRGKYLFYWGSRGRDAGEFSAPRGLAIDSRGDVYVADTGNRRVQKFDRGGGLLYELPGAPDEGFVSPAALAFDHLDNLYVLDRGAKDVLVFSTTGGYLRKWNPGKIKARDDFRPVDVAVEGKKWVFVLDRGTRCVYRFDLKWERAGKFCAGKRAVFPQKPAAVHADDGYLYIVDDRNNLVYKFSI